MEGDNRLYGTLYTAEFQSTPSAWRETGGRMLTGFYQSISIHSLRMEGDFGTQTEKNRSESFQSTPSAWRETHLAPEAFMGCVFQSTPSAWRETLEPLRPILHIIISIHSLRMEGDYMRLGDSFIGSAFQSTPSAWRETVFPVSSYTHGRISIHSLRMEGDANSRLRCQSF